MDEFWESPAVVVGATDEQLYRALDGLAVEALLGPPAADRPAALLDAVLAASFGALAPAARGSALLLVLADRWSRWAADRFARHCADPDRRLRPSDSTGLETGELFRPIAAAGVGGWRGETYLLGGADPATGVALARRAGIGGRAVLLCEVLPIRPEEPKDHGCLATVAVWPAVGRPPVSAPDHPALVGTLLAALTGTAHPQPKAGV